MRLIDADALIVALKRKAPISDSMRVMWTKCLQEVRFAPTIEPETEEEAYERGYTAGQMAQRKTERWIPVRIVCQKKDKDALYVTKAAS